MAITCERSCLEQLAPSVSPDGSKIAFLVAYGPFVRDAADHVDLVVANRDGSDQRVLLLSSWVREGREPTYTPVWSPDSRCLAFVDAYAMGGSTLYVIDADGRNRRRVTLPRDDVRHHARAAWSPKGDLIAFNLARADGVPEVHLIRPDGTGLKRLTVSRGNTGAWAPAWSRDGSRLAFIRWDPVWEEKDLWWMRSDGSRQVRVTRTRQNENEPTWLP